MKKEQISKKDDKELIKVIKEISEKFLNFHYMIEQFNVKKERLNEMNENLKIDLKEINYSKEKIV